MFYGLFSEWQRDKSYLSPAFNKALAFLEGRDPADLAVGKYAIDGNAIFALVQNPVTEPETLRRFEAHARYFDLQLLITGEEKQLYAANSEGTAITENLFAEKDAAFYTPPAVCNAVILRPMTYTVYAPMELHAPNCDASMPGCALRKIVFKIRKDAV